MRKLSAAPLFILILVFLWAHFAGAVAVTSSGEIPTDLPATLPTKRSALRTTLPTTLPALLPKKKTTAKLITKKKKIIVVEASAKLRTEAAAKLPKQLPAKTKIVMNFDEPVSIKGPQVVVRESAPVRPSNNEIQVIHPHEISDAPVLEESTAAASPVRQLHPALPDSDSFVVLPPGLRRATPINEPVRKQVSTPVIAPNEQASNEQAPDEQTADQEADQTDIKPDFSSSHDFVGPLPPPSVAHEPIPMISSMIAPNTPMIVDTVSAESEKQLDTEKAADSDGYLTHGQPTLSTTFLIPHDEIPHRRLFVRGGYLDAKYDRLESDLKNGATLFGVSASQVFSKTEVRLGLDVAHGLDQEVNLRNTRMLLFRAEGLYTIFGRDGFQIYLGGAIGVADIDVNSYRSSGANNEIIIRENARGTALLAAPEIGSRVRIGRQISLDLTLQYLLLAGGDQLQKLGGLLGEAAVGFRF